MPPSPTFPRAQALVLAAAKISEAVACCFVMPFVNQMVVGFGKTPKEAPKYAGLIDSALIVTEFIFAPVWGAASDRLGRKPLLILGLLGFALASVGMGLAQNLPQAITARCISGVLGAVGVLIRTVQFEITTSEHVGRVLKLLTPCWAIGAAIGPMIGGGLAEPAKTLPWLFAGTIFDRFPYLLPSLVSATIPAISAIGYWIFVPETLGNPCAESSPAPRPAEVNENTSLLERRRARKIEDDKPSELLAELMRGEQGPAEEVSTWRMIIAPRLAFPLVCSALLSFVSMSYNAGFMMMAGTSLQQGGLGLATWQSGVMLGISSGLGFFIASCVLPRFEARYGWYRTLRITSFAHVLLFPLIIVTGLIARAQGGVGSWAYPVLAMLLISYEIGETSFTPIDVAICDRAPASRLGAINGIAMSCQSIGRMAAPALSGQLWSWSMASKSTLGYQFIWIIFTIIAVIWHGSTLRLLSPAEIEARNALRISTSLESGSSRSILLLTPSQSYGTFSSIINSVKSLKPKLRRSPSTPEVSPFLLPWPTLGRSNSPESLNSAASQPIPCHANPSRNAPQPSSYVVSHFFRRASEADRYDDHVRCNCPLYQSYDPALPVPPPAVSERPNTVPHTVVHTRGVPGSAPSRPSYLRQTSAFERYAQEVQRNAEQDARRGAFKDSAPHTYNRSWGTSESPSVSGTILPMHCDCTGVRVEATPPEGEE